MFVTDCKTEQSVQMSFKHSRLCDAYTLLLIMGNLLPMLPKAFIMNSTKVQNPRRKMQVALLAEVERVYYEK